MEPAGGYILSLAVFRGVEVSGKLRTQASSPDMTLPRGLASRPISSVVRAWGIIVLRRTRNNGTPVTTGKATRRSEPGYVCKQDHQERKCDGAWVVPLRLIDFRRRLKNELLTSLVG